MLVIEFGCVTVTCVGPNVEEQPFISFTVTKYVPAKILVTESNDPRSYRVNSDKLISTGFRPNKNIEIAISEMVEKFISWM